MWENEAMETSKRLHPLLIVAAVSLTAFSAVGIAALTGLLPQSKGASDVFDAPKQVAQAAEPAAAPAPAPAAVPAAPAVTPAAPAKPAVQHKRKAAAPVVYKDFEDAPKVAQASSLP